MAQTQNKKVEQGYAFRFPKPVEEPVVRTHHPELYTHYLKSVRPALAGEFKYKNALQTPGLTKIVLNIGLGEALRTPKLLEQSFEALGYVAGQRPVVTRARKSIATFKLREGQKIGCMVTLRGVRMWDFLERLTRVALPRTRDFRGVSRRAFDGRGNYTLGVKEILIFPEVDIDKLDQVPGMNVCIHTSARTDNEARELLKQLGMPFRAN